MADLEVLFRCPCCKQGEAPIGEAVKGRRCPACSAEWKSEDGLLRALSADRRIGYKDFLYVTGGARFDANSAFGSNFSTQTYPKLSASFIPTAAFDMSGTGISTLRLRAAIGKSGQQPTFFDEFTTFQNETGANGVLLARPALYNTSIFRKPPLNDNNKDKESF